MTYDVIEIVNNDNNAGSNNFNQPYHAGSSTISIDEIMANGLIVDEIWQVARVLNRLNGFEELSLYFEGLFDELAVTYGKNVEAEFENTILENYANPLGLDSIVSASSPAMLAASLAPVLTDMVSAADQEIVVSAHKFLRDCFKTYLIYEIDNLKTSIDSGEIIDLNDVLYLNKVYGYYEAFARSAIILIQVLTGLEDPEFSSEEYLINNLVLVGTVWSSLSAGWDLGEDLGYMTWHTVVGNHYLLQKYADEYGSLENKLENGFSEIPSSIAENIIYREAEVTFSFSDISFSGTSLEGTISGYIEASDGSAVSGVVSFALDDSYKYTNIVSDENNTYAFSKTFSLPDEAQDVDVLFTAPDGSQVQAQITVPALTADPEEEDPVESDQTDQVGTSLIITDLATEDEEDELAVIVSGHVMDNQGNNPSGTVTITTSNGYKTRTFSSGSNSSGSLFEIESVDKETYDRLATLTIETVNGLKKTTSVIIQGTSGLSTPNPDFQFITPNTSTRWCVETDGSKQVTWSSVGIDPDDTYMFYLYTAGLSLVKRLGPRGADYYEDTFSFGDVTPGVYKIRVQNYTTGDYLAWSDSFTITDTNDAPTAHDITITAFAGEDSTGKIWFADSNDDPLSLSVTVLPEKGSVTVQQTGSFTYTADASTTGSDQFTVEISDGTAATEAVVTITILDADSYADFDFRNGWSIGHEIKDFVVANDLVYVADGVDDVVLIYDFQGNSVDTIGTGEREIAGIAVGDGYIAIVDYSEDLYIYSEETRELLWSEENISSVNPTDIVIGAGYVYVSFEDGTVEQVLKYNLETGSGWEFANESGDYETEGEDIDVIYYYRFEGTYKNFVFFTGTGGSDEELHWWIEEGSTGYIASDTGFGDDVTAIFARDEYLYGGDDSGDLSKLQFTGTGFSDSSGDGYTKYGIHDDDIRSIYSDGYELFTVSDDYSIKIWADKDCTLKQVISPATNVNAHTDLVIGLAYTGGILFTADRSGTIKTWVRNFIPAAAVNEIVTWSGQPVEFVVNVTDLDEDDSHVITIGATPGHGSAEISASGTVTYSPDDYFSGDDSFEITIGDGKDIGTVTVQVVVKNRPAEAVVTEDDFGSTGTVNQTISLTGSGVDPENDMITQYQWALLDSPENSVAELSSLSSATSGFIPDVVGVYAVGLKVYDGSSWSDQTVIEIPVWNYAPEASLVDFVVTANNSATASLLVADENIDDTFTYTVSSYPSHGTVSVSAEGEVEYTPDGDFTGDDYFSICVSDGKGATVTVDVSFLVTNSAPIGISATGNVTSGVLYSGNLRGYDLNGDDISFQVVDYPVNGTFSLIDSSTGAFTYFVDSEFEGEESTTFVVSDTLAESETATITFVAAPVCPSVYLEGDVNGDDSVNLKDVISTLQVLAGTDQSITVSACADINGNSKIDLNEAIIISRRIAGFVDPEVFFSEDFEGNSVGVLPDGWDISSKWGDAGSIRTVETPDVEGMISLMVKGLTSTAQGVLRTSTLVSEDASILVSIYVPSGGVLDKSPGALFFAGIRATFKYGAEGSFYVRLDSNTEELLTGLQTDQWEQLKLSIDWDNSTCKLEHVGGETIGPFNVTLNTVGGWLSDLSLYGNNNAVGHNVIYYDTISIQLEAHDF